MDLKGLKLTLDMDIEKFKSGVDAAITNAKKLDNEIKGLQKSFKFDPTNTQVYQKYISTLQSKFEDLEDTYTFLSDRIKNAEIGTDKWYMLQEALATVNREMDSVLKEQDKARELFSNLGTSVEYAIDDLEDFEKTLNDQEDELDDADRKFKTLGDDVEETGEEFKEADGKSNIFFGNLEANLASTVITKGFQLIGDAISFVVDKIKALISGYVDLMKQGIEYNAQMEKYSVSLHAIGEANGEAVKDVDSLINKMKLIGRTSSFSASSLLQAAQQLAASGISMQDATRDISNLQKLLAYAGKGDDELSRMAQNLNQIKNAGKAMAVDLKQFAYSGIPVYKLLADYSDEFKEITKETVVTYEDLVNAFNVASDPSSQFFNANAIQLQTFSGQLTQLKSQWDILLGALSEDTTSTLSTQLLPKVNEFVGKLIGSIVENQEYAEQANKELTGKLFDFPEPQSVAETFKNGIGEVIQALIDSDIIETFLETGIMFVDALDAAFDPETEKGKENLDKLTTLIDKLTTSICNLLTDTQIVTKFEQAGARIGDAVADGFKSALKKKINESNFLQEASDMNDPSNIWDVIFDSGGFGDTNNKSNYGALKSGGFSSGGITLNASFSVTGVESLDEKLATQFADLMVDRVNEELGMKM